MTRRENAVVKSIKRWLDTLDYCYYHKTHAGRFSMKGKPDITGVIYGIRFEIECKQQGKQARPLQEAVLRKWSRAGALVGVAHNVAEAKAILRPALENKGQLLKIISEWG